VAEDNNMSPEIKAENERWKDYSSSLLIAIPVLLAGITIADPKTVSSILSAIAGLAGLVLVVMWHGRDKNWIVWDKYPGYLLWASSCFGAQAFFLAVEIITSWLK
jgi:hypothetical protein